MSGDRDRLLAAFTQWVASEEGRRHLDRHVERIVRHVRATPGLLAVWPYPSAGDPDPGAQREMRADVGQDLLVFILESFTELMMKQPDLAEDLARGRVHHLLQYAAGRWLARWRDSARNKERNPFNFLYRRLRESISASPLFATDVGARSGIAYAPAQATIEPGDWWIDDEHLLAELDPPPAADSGDPERYLFTTEFLVTAAGHFADGIMRRLDRPRFLPIRALTTYLSRHYPWVRRPEAQSLDAMAETGYECAIDEKGPEQRAEEAAGLESLRCLAEQLTASFSDEECRVLLWRMEEKPVTFRQIAGRLGLENEHAAYRLFSRLRTGMTRFVGNCPGPFWDDLPDSVAALFLDYVLDLCKNRLRRP